MLDMHRRKQERAGVWILLFREKSICRAFSEVALVIEGVEGDNLGACR